MTGSDTSLLCVMRVRMFTTAVLAVGWLACFPLLAQPAWENVERIVAVGDVHGDYDNFVAVLRNAGVINRRGNWQAGNTHLVQMGDVPDRGPDTDRVIDLLQKLERQARRRDGMVHVLIGNHEAMNILGDLRYVHPGEYQAFVDRNSERLRDRYYELDVRQRSSNDPEFEASPEFENQWYERIPLGYVEHRLAWSPEGDYGSWVLGHNAAIRINRVLFLHGGLSSQVMSLSLEEINRAVRDELSIGESGAATAPAGLATSENGPLWYRGLASHDETSEASLVDAILERYDVDHIVIGHTPGLGTIVPRFEGKVLIVDSGISDYYGGYLTSLTIEDDNFVNTQQDQEITIPTGTRDLIPYFEEVLRLNPDLNALRTYIQSLVASDVPVLAL